jgi:hypothetical protein
MCKQFPHERMCSVRQVHGLVEKTDILNVSISNCDEVSKSAKKIVPKN